MPERVQEALPTAHHVSQPVLKDSVTTPSLEQCRFQIARRAEEAVCDGAYPLCSRHFWFGWRNRANVLVLFQEEDWHPSSERVESLFSSQVKSISLRRVFDEQRL